MSSISFDRAVDYYDATRGYPPGVAEQVADAIVAAAGATPESRFLELGIGTGRIAFPLIARGYDYSGIDLSEPMMAQLRAKVVDYAKAHPQASLRLDLRQGDSTRLPYADNSFDVVLTVHVLHLIPNWQQAIQEAVRVLKPGGIYLNGADDAMQTGGHYTVQKMWFAIIQRLGYDTGQMGMGGFATGDAIFHFLQERGLRPELLRTVIWQISETPRQAVEYIAKRLWSRTWVVPDEIFAESVTLLRAEAVERFGDAFDTPEQRTMQFVLQRAVKGT